MQPCLGSPWLLRHGPHGSSNVQLVPRIQCGASSGQRFILQAQISPQLQQQHCTEPRQRAAAAAGCSSRGALAAHAPRTSRHAATSSVACRASASTAPTAPLPMEQHDPDPTKARLHALYRFVMDNQRLPKVGDTSVLHAAGSTANLAYLCVQQQLLLQEHRAACLCKAAPIFLSCLGL
jgi:hypothetical protein